MLFCLLINSKIESRTSTVIGPFNIVYGLGAACLIIFLYRFRNRNSWLSFIGSMSIGSFVEYGCSYFQELLFGAVSWDYSTMPLNLSGRICLLYSLFWGLLGLCWIKYIYPLLSIFILKIPNQLGKTITIVLTALLILNYGFSGLVAYRWKQRNQNIPASNAFFKTIDKFYPDEKMQKIYPNLNFIK